MTALQAAFPLPQVADLLAVTGDLHLDMPGTGNQPLDIELAIAEGGAGFGAAALECVRQLGGVGDQPHAPATTSGQRLEQHRGARRQCLDEGLRLLQRGGLLGTLDHGHALALGQLSCLSLVAEQFQYPGVRADEGDTRLGAGAGQLGALAEETVAGMDGIAALLPGQRDNLGNLQIGAGAASAQGHGLIRLAQVQGGGIVLGVDGDAGDIQLGGGAGDSDGNLAAVGNQQALEGHQIQSLSSFFLTLPVAVIGRLSTMRISGTLWLAMTSRHQSVRASAVSPLPGLATTKASGISPRRSSGRPITAEASRSGCWPSMASSSAGNTLIPLTLSISLRRPR